MAAPLMLLTILGLFGALLLVAFASFAKKYALLKFVAGGAGLWLVAYMGLLFYSSLSSQEKKLSLNQPKAFCGFYLDCHLHAAVTDVTKTKTLTGPAGEQSAAGMFYVVTVKIFSDARRARIGLLEPRAVVTDERGREFARAAAAEQLLPDPSIRFDQQVAAGDSFSKQLVFDLPGDAVDPGLELTEGYAIDHGLEMFLIGDEDSILHKRVRFRLEPRL